MFTYYSEFYVLLHIVTYFQRKIEYLFYNHAENFHYYFIFKIFLSSCEDMFINLRERGMERARETSIGCLSYSGWGLNFQPRYVP